ncbi:FTR1 family iron permease [Bifidobacterium boum]|uniref:FTR1 family iron permease n=1 Tax=Bifidobacterium boum TaxID=78343 RepID=UPI003C6C6F97
MNTTATGGRTTSSGTGALLVIAAVCATVFAIFAPTIMPSRANAAEVTYTTWRQVADAIAAQLNQGEQKYADGNTAGASSDFMAAYNTIYVGSNFTTVVHDTLGTDRQADHQRQFQTITSLSYTTGNSAQIAQQVVALNADLHTAATTLDANTSLDKPDVYARKLAAQIKADRKRLDAAKTKNNGKGARTWSEVAKEMGDILDKALAAYAHGDGAKGAGYVNDAYYQYYEKLGFEKNVMNAISGGRVSQVEYQFKESRQAMNNGEPIKQASQYVTDLKAMLVEDAATLDGGAAGKVNPFTAFVTSAFGQAFIILLREGLEAILVVAAIIAYLIKTGNKSMTRYIYFGVAAGLAASGILAVVFNALFGGSGPQQEITEGVVALIAMLMLLYTSNWMLSRSSEHAWNAYIKDKTVAAVSKGSLLSLAMLSFLAVFREGAETVIFYQAIFSMVSGSTSGIWWGAACAAVVLVIVFLLIRCTSVNMPIRPFFIVTSVFMAVLVVIFAGGGVHALIEGDAVNGTYLKGVPTSDWLGLYPYAETIAAQTAAAIVVITLTAVALIKEARTRRQLAGKTES